MRRKKENTARIKLIYKHTCQVCQKILHTPDGNPIGNTGDTTNYYNGGYDGYFSSLVYYRYALNYFDVQNIINTGPSQKFSNPSSDTFAHIPPYFSSNNHSPGCVKDSLIKSCEK